MCAFRGCKVKSDKKVLKKDGIIAYKTLRRGRPGQFYSKARGTPWKNKRMTLLPGTTMLPTGSGPGIYAWKRKPARSYTGTTVKVLLYGRVIEYAGYKGAWGASLPAGYMAERAEILEVV